MVTQKREVQAFFDRIATDYSSRFDPKQDFHHYFFTQRLQKATESFDFSGKTVLDVGAGTGPLYDLVKEASKLDYYATDVSAAMLEQSAIPAERRFVGELDKIDLVPASFDLVFLLGVTSYLDQKTCSTVLHRIGHLLKPNGTAVVSFTQSGSIDHYARMLMGWPVKIARAQQTVMGQRFAIKRYNPSEVRQLCGDQLRLDAVSFLNQTIFPFNRLFEKASIGLANWMEGNLSQSSIAKLSSDFLVHLKKRSQ